jgi:Domain of unknown function (DUF5618)
MSIQEQNTIKIKYYTEAMRYLANAKDTLKSAKKEDDFFGDIKYVKTACGTAYNGVLLALDGYFLLKGIEKPKKGRKSIEYYTNNVAKLDGKLTKELKAAYDILHLSGYYDGTNSVKVVSTGFEVAHNIIKRIEPIS